MSLNCRKRQKERNGDQVLYRCVHKKADTYRSEVSEAACAACPLAVLVKSKKKGQKNLADLPVIETGPYPSCEFRVAGTCAVTSLPVNPEICNRCAKDTKMETARFGEKVMNYSKALRKWIAAGRPERTDEEVAAILAEHCGGCRMYDKKREVCNSCGCPANKNLPAIRNKLKMATEACPLGRFGTKE